MTLRNKTPEQMAEEYANNQGDLEDTYCWRADRDGFLAGYQTAKDEYKVAIDTYNDVAKQMLEEAIRIMSPKDQLADADKVMNSPEKLDSWISVHKRLPEFTEGWCIVYGANTGWRWMVQPAYYDAHKEEWMSRFIKHRSEIAVDGKLTEWIEYLPLEDVTHWMPLPAPPEEDK